MHYRIVETDNFGGDYPNEKFVDLPRMNQQAAQRVADAINKECCSWDNAPRFWKVVHETYELKGGFEA